MRRGLRIEPLEARLLLAADVTLDLGVLRLSDNIAEANDISMRVVAGGTQVELLDAAGLVPDGNEAFYNGSDTVRYDLAAIVRVTIETGAASDTVQVESSPMGVETLIDTGAENDALAIGDAAGTLDGIKGLVRLVGGSHAAMPLNSAAVTAATTTISVTTPVGDRLTISDEGNGVGNTYFLTDGTLGRPSGGTDVLVTFHAIETVELVTGDAADTIQVGLLGDMDVDGSVDFDDVDDFVLGLNDPAFYASTFGVLPVVHGDINGDGQFDFDDIPGFTDLLLGIAPLPQLQTTVDGRGGADRFDVVGTLAGSILGLSGGDATDEMTIVLTGPGSVTSADAQADADVMTLVASGLDSGIDLHGGAAGDQIAVQTTATGSVTVVEGGVGNDGLLLMSSGSSSSAAVDGGDGNDTVTVVTSGADSTMEVDAGSGDDLLELWATGGNAATRLSGSDGEDLFRIQTTAAGSDTRVSGGAGNDVVELGSASDATGVVTGIAGTLLIDGSFHDPLPTVSASVTADGRQIEREVPTGDTLTINDPGYTNPAQYQLGATSFDRDGTAAVTTFFNIETIDLSAGSGVDNIDVTGTPASSHTTVTSQDAMDDVDVTETGNGSILTLQTAGAADQIDIAVTGTGSVVHVDSGDDDDQLVVAGSGNTAGVALAAGDGADEILAAATGIDSLTAISGGPRNDTVTIGNSLANVGGAIEVRGGDHDLVPTQNVVGPASVAPRDPYIPAGVDPAHPAGSQLVPGPFAAVPAGDRLFISDDSTVSDQNYTIDNQHVTRVGGPTITYSLVEKLQLTAGAGDDLVTVSMPDVAPPLPAVVAVDGHAGADHIVIQGTSGNDNMTVNTGTDTGPFAISQIDCMQLAAGRGSDVVVNATGTRSLILGDAVVNPGDPPPAPGPGGDDDILVGGSSTDILFASYGIDALFGGNGNDFLFADVATTAVPNGIITFDDPPASGDLIDGGNGIDSAAQLGSSDIIRNINGTLVDGGGIKNVITWLRARLVPFTDASVNELVDAAYTALGCGLPVVVPPSPMASPAVPPAVAAVATATGAAADPPTPAIDWQAANSHADRRLQRYAERALRSIRRHGEGRWASFADYVKLRARDG